VSIDTVAKKPEPETRADEMRDRDGCNRHTGVDGQREDRCQQAADAEPGYRSNRPGEYGNQERESVTQAIVTFRGN
jgi:hypothetical protein